MGINYKLHFISHDTEPEPSLALGDPSKGMKGTRQAFLVERCHTKTEILILIRLSLYCLVLRGAASESQESGGVTMSSSRGSQRWEES